MRLDFLGAAGTVTGSKYLLEAGKTRVLVDCGLYQGVKTLRLRNWAEFPVEPASIDAVLLTHAHIDHSGYLPALVRNGFGGPIFCSEPTAELCRILLPDAAYLQEEDASYANRKGFSKHRPSLPLFDGEDAAAALERLRPIDFDQWRELGSLRFRLRGAGHILGAASITLEHEGRSVHFSGDLGRSDDLLMHPPESPGDPDWVVIESTYGDRRHPELDPFESVAEVLTRTVARGGVLLVPSFAVGRAQTLLYCLHEIFRRGLAERVPVFVNSPMATDVTRLFGRMAHYHRLDAAQAGAVCDVAHYVRSVEESRALAARRDPAVIISASGMASGGRVLHHLRALAPKARNTLLFPGFQAPGTRGDAIVNGAERVKIHGQQVPIAAEVVQLDIFSAHADQAGLLAWLAACEKPPRRVFVTHGEAVPADRLRRLVKDELGFPAHAPEYREVVQLSAGVPAR
jgi:metallo-beta-lactamase family protein